MKKFLSILLTVCLLASIVTTDALADNIEYLIVTRDQAPIRTDDSEKAPIVARASKGEILISTGITINNWLNRWYVLDYHGQKCYIYSGNISVHTHNYTRYTYQGVRYAVCPECGHATVTLTQSAEISYSKAEAVAGYVSLGVGMAASDGILPAGDVIGILVTGIGCLYAVTTPSATMVTELTRDLIDYMHDDTARSCNGESFYLVKRVYGDLYIVDPMCMTIPEAYAMVSAGRDVWVYSKKAAIACASLHGTFYQQVDKNQPGYFWHCHMGTDDAHRDESFGHIFYGKSVVYNEFPKNMPH